MTVSEYSRITANLYLSSTRADLTYCGANVNSYEKLTDRAFSRVIMQIHTD